MVITKPEPDDKRSTRETLFLNLLMKAYKNEILAYDGIILSYLDSLWRRLEKHGLFLTRGSMVVLPSTNLEMIFCLFTG